MATDMPALSSQSTITSPDGIGVIALKLTFESSSDFFGRVTVYDLKLEGYIV